MELYDAPEMEIVRFDDQDIILTSGFDPELPPDDDF